MLDQVRQTLLQHAMLAPGDNVVVGLSGGADSVCLLHLLYRLQQEFSFRLHAAHLNHQLRGEDAERDEQFVRRFCASLSIPLFVESVPVAQLAKEQGIGLELAGRQARYAFFDRLSLPQKKIAIAHTKNDHAESVLLHLLRGCGGDGLEGMEPVRGQIIRPLLSCSRAQVEAYCKEQNLSFCTDQSNFSEVYTRNRIRLQLLPQLEQHFNPQIVDCLVQTADILQQENEYLQKQVSSFWQLHTPVECSGSRTEFLQLHTALQRRILREGYRQITGHTNGLTFACIEQARMVAQNDSNGKYAPLTSSVWMECTGKKLLLFLKQEITPFSLPLTVDCPITLPDKNQWCLTWADVTAPGLHLHPSLKDQPLRLRNRLPGDVLFQNGHHHKLKKLYQEQGIPRHRRDLFPVVEYGKDIIAAWGIGTDPRFAPTDPQAPTLTLQIKEQER